MMNDMHSLLKI